MKPSYIFSLRNFPLLILLMVSSCKKFVEVAPPDYQLSSDLVFVTDNAATSAVVSMYGRMSSDGGITPIAGNISLVYGGLYADELVYSGSFSTYPEFADNALDHNTYMVNVFWKSLYSLLYQTNACIEALNKATGLTPAVKDQLLGESEFIRAYCYFYLVNYWGDVPLVTTTNYEVNAVMRRTPQADVYQQIIKDLKDARLLLKETYPTAERVRVNKWAATALLARVYLYTKEWVNAETMASAVIGAGTYTPLPALSSVFLKGSTETIWQLMSVAPTVNTYDGIFIIPSDPTVIPTYVLSPGLLTALGTTDPRKTSWTATPAVAGISYTHPFKYKVRSATAFTEYSVQLRLAEQYLIRAEALANQNKVPDAVTDINAIRSRAGATPLIASNITQPACLLAIEQERRIELFAEMGHRFLDLKRTGRADAVLGAQKAGWNSGDALFPIPIDQIKANPFLIQNDAYKK